MTSGKDFLEKRGGVTKYHAPSKERVRPTVLRTGTPSGLWIRARPPLVLARICPAAISCRPPCASRKKKKRYGHRGGGWRARTLAGHLRLVSRALAALPEALAGFGDEAGAAKLAVLGPVVLLAGAETAYHPVGMLDGVIARRVVTAVAGENFATAAETEPPERLGVVATSSPAGELGAGDYAEVLADLGARECRERTRSPDDERKELGGQRHHTDLAPRGRMAGCGSCGGVVVSDMPKEGLERRSGAKASVARASGAPGRGPESSSEARQPKGACEGECPPDRRNTEARGSGEDTGMLKPEYDGGQDDLTYRQPRRRAGT
jgi:hypothetical protein